MFLERKRVYPLSREEREEIYEFTDKQLRKRYIRSSKSPQMALVFFVGKNNSKKHIVQDYRYLNEQLRITILFFLNQHFIMWDTMAVYGNYLVAIIH